MVEKIVDNNSQCVKCTIIPQLHKHNEISLKRGDTLVVHIPFDTYDLDSANVIYEMFAKAFPYNQVIVVDKDIELEVVRDGE